MELSEYYTYQFYLWDLRLRGIYESTIALDLEPPYVPYIRKSPYYHGFDDGKKQSWLNKIIGKKSNTPLAEHQEEAIDYDYIEHIKAPEVTDFCGFRLHLPKERIVDKGIMTSLLSILSSTEHTLSFEIIGTKTSIAFVMVCSDIDAPIVASLFASYLPTIPLQKDDSVIETILQQDILTTVVSFCVEEEITRPLALYDAKAIDPYLSLMAIIEQVEVGEQVGVQILFKGTVNKWKESLVRSVTMNDGSSFFVDDKEAPKRVLEKVATPLFAVSIKAFAQSTTLARRKYFLTQIASAISTITDSGYNRLRMYVQIIDEDSIDHLYLRTTNQLGFLASAQELAQLVHIPNDSIRSKKIVSHHHKSLCVPHIAQEKDFVMGENNHNGERIVVSFGIDERLKHTHIIGATGTGKSTLIANLILQDIVYGNGVTVIDPHGDLIDDVIARLPSERLKDVILLDPSDTDYPIGLTFFEAHSELEKEMLASDLVASFRKHATSWGDQMSTVLGNAILAMLEHSEGGTLQDLRRFLIEKEFRNEYLKKVQDPAIIYYWRKEYPLLKNSSIGSILTRLDTFLRPKMIRNMVVQQKGLNIDAVLAENKILLVKLSQGLMGKENSYLLGTLLVSKLHQAALARQALLTRTPHFIYIDEFQHFLTPSIAEMLSGVRKYGVGLVLSHQDLSQLQKENRELLDSILANIYTRIMFRVGEPDAKVLEQGLMGIDRIDLQSLGKGEAILRMEQPQYTTTLATHPLHPIALEQKQAAIAIIQERTRTQYASTKTAVEKALLASMKESLLMDDVIEKEEENLPTVATVEETTTITETPIPILNTSITEEVTLANTLVLKEEVSSKKENTRDVTTHKYLQNLVKKMAEANGFTASIEHRIDKGQVDVLLAKATHTIAIEICNTTEVDWEVHNIEKCLAENIDVIISLSGDVKQLDKIQRKCKEVITDFEKHTVLFMTPDVLFEYLAKQDIARVDDEIKEDTQTIKGYRVKVSYDSVTQEEMKSKRNSVSQIVMKSLHKRKK